MISNIFECAYFPDSWSKAFIVPLLKKGDKNNPNNSRGISIVSCFGKLFTSILNNRILAWERDHNILTDVQFGFRSGLSTVDAIFVFQSIINRILCKNKRLYCCFVDYQKAFDSVDRTKLWKKLFNSGIQVTC